MQHKDVTMKAIPSHGTNIYIRDTYMEKTQLLLQKKIQTYKASLMNKSFETESQSIISN